MALHLLSAVVLQYVCSKNARECCCSCKDLLTLMKDKAREASIFKEKNVTKQASSNPLKQMMNAKPVLNEMFFKGPERVKEVNDAESKVALQPLMSQSAP